MMRILSKGERYVLNKPNEKKYFLFSYIRQCMLLMAGLFSFQFVCLAQESPVNREATETRSEFKLPPKPTYNYILYDAVWSEPIVSEKYYNDAIQRYPKADLYKYPMASYHISEDKIPWVKEGELLPDEVLDLPLWVVNDEYGRDTITLRSEMDKEWIILHFWFESCPPCIRSMNNWENLSKTEGARYNLIGAFTSLYPHKAAFEARRFGWNSTQVIGESMKILSKVLARNHYSSGSSIWIKNARVFGFTSSKLTNQDQKMILKGELTEIPEYARWVVRNK